MKRKTLSTDAERFVQPWDIGPQIIGNWEYQTEQLLLTTFQL
jgi:hypothetical protein